MRVCVITHAVISSTPPFTPSEMKGFPPSQSSFFVSMVLWFCQNPREKQRGREKKINFPPITSSSLSLAGRRHARAHASTCKHGQWETHKQKSKLPLWLHSVNLIFSLLFACWRWTTVHFILDISDNSSRKGNDPGRLKWTHVLSICR